MKAIILLLIASLAVATHGSYLPTAWPHAAATWSVPAVGILPYANSWSYPSVSVYNNNAWNNGIVSKVNPWGLYGAGWGYHGLARSVVPVEKQIAATPGSLEISPVPVGGERLIGY